MDGDIFKVDVLGNQYELNISGKIFFLTD